MGLMAGSAIVGGLLGGLGGLKGTPAQKTTTTTSLTPGIGGQNLQPGFDQAHNVLSQGMAGTLYNVDPRLDALIYGGGGGGGSATRSGVSGGGGGGGGGGRGGWWNAMNRMGNMNDPAADFRARMFDENWLDVGNNPTIQGYLDALQRENQESMDYGMSASYAPFAGGGTMGNTGANLMERLRVGDDYNENLLNQQSGALMDAYGQNLQAALGASGQEVDLMNALRGAGASMYGSDAAKAAAIRSAQIGRSASNYAADKSASTARRGQTLDAALALQGLNRQAGIDRMNAAGSWLGGYSPAAAQWGTQKSVSKTPGQGGGFSGLLTGGIGGALSGAGFAGKMGWQ